MNGAPPPALVLKRILEAVRAGKARGRTQAQLRTDLGIAPGDREGAAEVRNALAEAERRGEVVAGPRGGFVATEYTDSHSGRLRMTSRGFGILRPESRDDAEIVVPPEHLHGALDGDLVLVHREVKRRKGRVVPERYGEVVRVLQRRRPTLPGRFRAHPDHPWVDPYARRLQIRIYLEPWEGTSPLDGEFVEVMLLEGGDGETAKGRLLRRLGFATEPGTDEEVVLADLAIPVEFPPGAEQQARELSDTIGEEELTGREDCRGQAAVTIDGETARDFDDAVVAFPARGDAVEVVVHIADVSHYVTAGCALDEAAAERGTSVYLPGRAIPMLPERLSSGLCSLLAGEDRLGFSVRFLVQPDGSVAGCRAFRSVITSRRRCTYSEVFAWLDSDRWPRLPRGVKASLRLLDEAAQRLGRRRRQRGAIDFDLPEPEILLDPEGFMTGVQAAERNRAHRLIEELMIAANECVARILVERGQPAIFRVHERPAPERLAELDAVLREFGFELGGDLEELPPRELQRLLDAIVGRPEQRFLQTLILRALARAVYDTKCRGHYALATSTYLHFTSPIRRYPDLVVHRALAALGSAEPPAAADREGAAATLEEVARHCSYTERRAEEAEREVVRWKQAAFMRSRIGDEFHGHVTGVVAFGLFVQLSEVFVEGMVHVSSLRDDYYRYDELGHRLVGARGGAIFRLGDPLTVRVRGIDEERMEVELEVTGHEGRVDDSPHGGRRRRGGDRKPRARGPQTRKRGPRPTRKRGARKR